MKKTKNEKKISIHLPKEYKVEEVLNDKKPNSLILFIWSLIMSIPTARIL